MCGRGGEKFQSQIPAVQAELIIEQDGRRGENDVIKDVGFMGGHLRQGVGGFWAAQDVAAAAAGDDGRGCWAVGPAKAGCPRRGRSRRGC